MVESVIEAFEAALSYLSNTISFVRLAAYAMSHAAVLMAAFLMAAAIRGYRLVLIMPSHMSDERKWAMAAYGAELIEVTQEEGMEGARDLAMQMQAAGLGRENPRQGEQLQQQKRPGFLPLKHSTWLYLGDI